MQPRSLSELDSFITKVELEPNRKTRRMLLLGEYWKVRNNLEKVTDEHRNRIIEVLRSHGLTKQAEYLVRPDDVVENMRTIGWRQNEDGTVSLRESSNLVRYANGRIEERTESKR